MEESKKVHYFELSPGFQTAFFWLVQTFFRFVRKCCVRVRWVNRFPASAPVGCLVASNHNSHLDAHVIGALVRRKIDWLSRIEFFRSRVISFFLHAVSAIPIHRQGVPVRAIRTAMTRLRDGKTVGICPEGEMRSGPESVIYGGKIKRGVGLLAVRTGVPVVPCVVLGVQQLCRLEPWLPARRGEVWINFGEPIYPRQDLPGKEARELLCHELENQFCELYRQIRERYELPEVVLP